MTGATVPGRETPAAPLPDRPVTGAEGPRTPEVRNSSTVTAGHRPVRPTAGATRAGRPVTGAAGARPSVADAIAPKRPVTDAPGAGPDGAAGGGEVVVGGCGPVPPVCGRGLTGGHRAGR
ncbi:hypothetical protein ABZ690_12175 [Streptomyces sp. NPDC006967]|uniref:hypothetical protein n=1 Tax=Streptomyces sp. NPDC006967 TaxID=3156906 RepID=UPI0034108F3C